MISSLTDVRMRSTAAFLALALAACGGPAMQAPASAPAPQPASVAPSPQAAARSLPASLRWFRRSAEYRASARQTYALAAERLAALTQGRATGSWGVILDADETVLDNGEYEQRRAEVDSGYTDASWVAWVREASAPAVPGAVAYVAYARSLGGRVVIVTNRADSLCAPTRANLERVGVSADLVLCQAPGGSDKNPRFESVERGTIPSTLPALTVVEFLGDNIQDFPHMTQAVRTDSTALARFGRDWFILPNPMYGSWERNQAN